MNIDYIHSEPIEGRGKFRVASYGAHEHLMTPFIASLGDSDLSVEFQYQDGTNENIGNHLGIDPSFHRGYLSEDYWRELESQNLLEKIGESFPYNIDVEKRSISGPAMFMLYSHLNLEQTRQMGEERVTQMVVDRLEEFYDAGFGTVRDVNTLPGILLHTDFTHPTIKRHLKGVSIAPLTLQGLGDDIKEKVFERLGYLKREGYEIFVKYFGDGSFGARTVNHSYESDDTEQLGIDMINQMDFDGVIVHAIGDKAIINTTEFIRDIHSKAAGPAIDYEIHHVEIVTPEVLRALQSLNNDCKSWQIMGGDKPKLKLCPQPNFLAYDVFNYGRDYPELKDYQHVLPLRDLTYVFNTNDVDLGTDGMPQELSYLMASCLFHPHYNGRLNFDTFLMLIDKGRRENSVEVDTDAFAEYMNEQASRNLFLSYPNSGLVKERNITWVKRVEG